MAFICSTRMNLMKKTVFFTLALFVCAAQAATVYECTDRSGRKTYSQSGGKNCTASHLGSPSVYTSAVPSHNTLPPVEAAESRPQPLPATDNAALARQELQQAQQALEQGRKVRLGNERNYAKYLERVKGLEDNVKAAEDKLRAAQSGADSGGLR